MEWMIYLAGWFEARLFWCQKIDGLSPKKETSRHLPNRHEKVNPNKTVFPYWGRTVFDFRKMGSIVALSFLPWE